MMNQGDLIKENDPFEIVGHARGGQGMVTAFEILAKIFSHSGGYEVQAFPSFGVERTGAPIQGFLRISGKPILNRSNIYRPHLIVVFDESLISLVPVFDGLRDKGIVLLNTGNKPEMFKDKAPVIYTVPATKISLDNKLGSRSLPIVNSAMIGALVKILGGDIRIAREVIMAEVPAKPEANAEAAEISYNSLSSFINTEPLKPAKSNPAAPEENVTTTPYWTLPMSLNKTGNWRMSIPIYVTRDAPCNAVCPAGTDVRGFLELAAEKKFAEAAALIAAHNPFPSLCGRECPGYCEAQCNRKDHDGAIDVKGVEQFIGDLRLTQAPAPADLKYDQKIAVFGSGPGQLTAAFDLRRLGYMVKVFEPAEFAGGSLTETGDSEGTWKKEIERIVAEGVVIALRSHLTAEHIGEEYAAIITAAGPDGNGSTHHKNHHGVEVFTVNEAGGEFVKTIGSGNVTAARVHAFLRKLKFEPRPSFEDIVRPGDIKFQYYDNVPRGKKLSFTFEELIEGTAEYPVAKEAGRCLHCGSCYNCGNCFNFCPDALVFYDEARGKLRIDYEYCKGCGICFHECPSSAMKFDIVKKALQKT
jgi:2-oxoacid:acceptor oxidoreductase gamma subunit (pyruvate/2-ketoisovalerate family)